MPWAALKNQPEKILVQCITVAEPQMKYGAELFGSTIESMEQNRWIGQQDRQ